MLKLGMKPMPGVVRVTIKKSKNVRASRARPRHSPHARRPPPSLAACC